MRPPLRAQTRGSKSAQAGDRAGGLGADRVVACRCQPPGVTYTRRTRPQRSTQEEGQ